MRANHWIIGCALCAALMGPAVAASLDAQGVEDAAQAGSGQFAHDGDTIGGDGTEQGHGSGVIGSGATATGTTAHDNDRSGAASPAPAPASRPHLGWQSLLPGSIQ